MVPLYAFLSITDIDTGLLSDESSFDQSNEILKCVPCALHDIFSSVAFALLINFCRILLEEILFKDEDRHGCQRDSAGTFP